MSDDARIETARYIIEAGLDVKAERIVALDMRELTSFADTFIILSGRSDRQVKAIADSIIRDSKSRGEIPLGVEGLDEGHWVLIDLTDVIVHVFSPTSREEYNIERLWNDAPRLDLGIAGVNEDLQALESEKNAAGETLH